MPNEKTILHSSEMIRLEYLPAKKMIYQTTLRPVVDADVAEWKQALNKGAKALKDYGICKWLSDDRENGPVPQAIVDWGATDFTARAIQNGWKYWANVVPKDLVAAGTYVPIIQMFYDMGLRMQVFTSPEDAMAWLNNLE